MWTSRTLGELCDDGRGVIRTGPFGSQLHREDYQDTGVPVVMPQDIVDDRISTEKIARISEADALRLAQHRLAPGDIVYGRRGDIGRHALVTATEAGWLCGTGCLRVSLGEAEIHPEFLHYFLCNPPVIEWIHGQAVGATMPNLNTSILRSIVVVYPPLDQQRRIADVLSAYDDLIENNTRRIAILEEMARAIYREWFVDFRFPGHEQVEMVESELGPVPAGWEVVKLSKLVRTQYGYTESARDEPIGPRYLRGTDINKKSYIDWSGVPFCPIDNNLIDRYRLKIGDILVIRMADPGKVGIVEKAIDAVFASYLIRLEIERDMLSPYYLFYFLSSDRYQDYVTGASTGTTRKSASAGVVTDIEIILPPVDVRERFEHQISGLRRLLNNLVDQNDLLRRTRDLLLPRLISGDIDVPAMEEELAEATA